MSLCVALGASAPGVLGLSCFQQRFRCWFPPGSAALQDGASLCQSSHNGARFSSLFVVKFPSCFVRCVLALCLPPAARLRTSGAGEEVLPCWSERVNPF